MYYILNDNVYIVEGKAKSCIYDLNNSKLFSVNKALADKLIQINEKGISVDDVDCELKNILEQLVGNEIVKISQTHSSRYIKEIIGEDEAEKSKIENNEDNVMNKGSKVSKGNYVYILEKLNNASTSVDPVAKWVITNS